MPKDTACFRLNFPRPVPGATLTSLLRTRFWLAAPAATGFPYIAEIEFEWNDDKNLSNQVKHGVSFEDAKTVFADIYSDDILDGRYEYGEERWLTIGMAQGVVLAVVNTQRDERYRLISARRATRKEINACYKNSGGA